MKLLIDNNLPPRLGRGLGEMFAGLHEVQHIKDKFGTGDLPDDAWIVELGREGGWCVLSGDRHIATKKPSRDLFLASNLVGFFTSAAVSRYPLHQQASRVLYLWPVFERLAASTKSGCYEVGPKSDRLRQI